MSAVVVRTRRAWLPSEGLMCASVCARGGTTNTLDSPLADLEWRLSGTCSSETKPRKVEQYADSVLGRSTTL